MTGRRSRSLSPSGVTKNSDSRRRWVLATSAALVAAAVLAVAYTALYPRAAARPVTSGAGSPAAAPTSFAATAVSGRQVVQIPGGKPSILFFFSSTCGSCGPGARSLAQAQRDLAHANYVAVDVDPSDTVANVRAFLIANGASTLTYTMDPAARLTQVYQINQLSTAVVINASGGTVYRGVDPTPSQIRRALTKAGAA